MDGLRSATPPSAAVLGERKYPVVFAEPTLGQVCEFRARARGKRKGLSRPSPSSAPARHRSWPCPDHHDPLTVSPAS
jgi:hypothetical protein